MKNPIGISEKHPFISWNDLEGVTQTGYEINFISKGELIYSTGKVESQDMTYIYPDEAPELKSRQVVEYNIRVWDENNQVGPWSNMASFEMGLLDEEDFLAKWIDPEPKDSINDPAGDKLAVSILRKKVDLDAKDTMGKLRVYASARGIYEISINGKRLSDAVLAPGTSNYDIHMPVQTYDADKLFSPGENLIEVLVADGWARSCSGVDGIRNLYGDRLAFFMQVECDDKVIVKTDNSWYLSKMGPIREADMQQGEVYDARLEEVRQDSFEPVDEIAVTSSMVCADTVAIREHERFSGQLITTPNGQLVVDYGQNIAGYIEFTLNAHEGDKIIIYHGESLDENGNFTNENFQDHERHAEGVIQQRVEYICKEGLNHYKTKFSIWGFRYGLIETDINLSEAEFTAIAVYSQMEETGFFTSSNDKLNKLVENSKWSLKGNFCDIPTDCPTRERAGWTGDAGVFVSTGITLMNCYPVYRKWLRECRITQQEDGRVWNIAPKNGKISYFTELLSGSVGWGDASIIVPYTIYKRTGNINVLKDNYQMMKGWIGYLEQRAKGDKKEESPTSGGMPAIPESMASMIPEGLDLSKIDLSKYAAMMPGAGSDNGDSNEYADYTVDSGTDYGEWCEPGVNSQAAMAASSTSIATAYFAKSASMMAEVAFTLGDMAGAAHYNDIATKAKKAYQAVVLTDGRITAERQAEYVRALAFDLLDEDDAQVCAADLNQKVIDNDYHLNTGFLGTPNLCRVLCQYGYVDTAYKVLLQEEAPGWLYAVKKGATTIWETWDGIDEEGRVKDSLNHYSYGAITGWLISGICGISLEANKLVIAPTPNKSLPEAEAVYDSLVGVIRVSYRYHGDDIDYTISIPANVEAEVRLPGREVMTLKSGEYSF